MIEFLTALLIVFWLLSGITIFWKYNSKLSVLSTFGAWILFVIFFVIDLFSHKYGPALLDLLVIVIYYYDFRSRLRSWAIDQLLK